MKKMKKLMAALLAMVMMLAMTTTAFAATPQEGVEATNGKITVKGLTQGEETTVKIYKVVGWDAATNNWKVEDWAKKYVDLATNPVTINWTELEKIATDENKFRDPVVTSTGTAEFDNLGIGAYMVKAVGAGENAITTYTVMGSFTYGYDENHIMVPTDVEIDAKASDYKVVKKFVNAEDAFVGRGDEVDFTIDAVFPSYKEDDTNREFTITDEPTGMKIKEITVTVAGKELTLGQDYTLVNVVDENTEEDITLPAKENQAVTVKFTSDYIGTENVHAGEKVEVKVTAEVTGTDGFSNKATTNKSSKPSESEVVGDTGTMTIRKVDKDGNLLKEAVFSVAPFKDNQPGKKIQFVAVLDKEKKPTGEYYKANAEEIAAGNTTTELTTKDGVLVVKGLDEGEYKIVEEKAPDGYSIVEVKENPIIKAGKNADITLNVENTKLASLPGTGGIGTTIFTIGGCIIMIAAAAFYFLSRKKENN